MLVKRAATSLPSSSVLLGRGPEANEWEADTPGRWFWKSIKVHAKEILPSAGHPRGPASWRTQGDYSRAGLHSPPALGCLGTRARARWAHPAEGFVMLMSSRACWERGACRQPGPCPEPVPRHWPEQLVLLSQAAVRWGHSRGPSGTWTTHERAPLPSSQTSSGEGGGVYPRPPLGQVCHCCGPFEPGDTEMNRLGTCPRPESVSNRGLLSAPTGFFQWQTVKRLAVTGALVLESRGVCSLPATWPREPRSSPSAKGGQWCLFQRTMRAGDCSTGSESCKVPCTPVRRGLHPEFPGGLGHRGRVENEPLKEAGGTRLVPGHLQSLREA